MGHHPLLLGVAKEQIVRHRLESCCSPEGEEFLLHSSSAPGMLSSICDESHDRARVGTGRAGKNTGSETIELGPKRRQIRCNMGGFARFGASVEEITKLPGISQVWQKRSSG